MHLERIIEYDILELVEMSRLAHEESKYARWPFDAKTVRATFIDHLAGDALAVKVIADNQIAAFFIADHTGMVFTTQPIAKETSFWVRPEHRGSRCFFLLMLAFMEWAGDMPHIVMPHFAHDNTKTYSALEKLGFVEIGKIYARGI